MCCRDAPALASSATAPATGSSPRKERNDGDLRRTEGRAGEWLSLSGAGAVVLVVASFAGLGGDTPGDE